MLAVCIGLVLSGVAYSWAAEPARCCFDQQYSMQMMIVGETLTQQPFFLDITSYVGVDLYTNRQATKSSIQMPDGSAQIRTELKDFAARRVYTTVDNSSCVYADMHPYEIAPPRCIPDDAKFVGTSTIGYGHHSMTLHSWSFDQQLDETQSSTITLSVTAQHCVPIVESIIGVYQGIPLEESVFMVDYHPGIERLDYLRIPDNCQPAPSQ